MAEKNKKEKAMISGLPLPEELVLSSILPLLSMKDVARSSLVSHTWLGYWRNTPILSFDDPGMKDMFLKATDNEYTYFSVVSDAKLRFITWVNNVLSNHIGCRVEEFRVAYYLNNTHRVDIDWWVVWALSNHVQRLVLDFTRPPVTYGGYGEEKYYYALDRTRLGRLSKLCLTNLCLKSVNVDTSTLDYLLRACSSTLDDLCIVKSQYLTSIAGVELPSLKCLTVLSCPKLETIDIKAPNLVSLTYNSSWDSVLRVFNIASASKLCYAHIVTRVEDWLFLIFHSLFKYFSHLEILILHWRVNSTMNLVPDNFPVLANLKYLELFYTRRSNDRTLAAWVPFIGACPCLEKLTLELCGWAMAVPPKNVYQEKRPLRRLKTFEIRRFHGANLDVDIANFVVENAINLREVILHPRHLYRPVDLKAPFRGVDFVLPPHVKLVIVE